MSKLINFILARSRNNIIGINNALPWKIKEELQYFRKLTSSEDNSTNSNISNVCIMGSKTFESIGSKPLPKRFNIVLTSKYESYTNMENLVFLSSLENAIYYSNLMPEIKTIWIIGGISLFDKLDIIKPNNIYLNTIDFDIKLFESDNAIRLTDDFISQIDLKYNLMNLDVQNHFDINSSEYVDVRYEHYEIINPQNQTILSESSNSHRVITNGENDYLRLLKDTIISGDFRKTRNDLTWSTFGSELKFDSKNGFPLLTSKRVPFRLIFEELMFFIRGWTDNKILKDKNIHIWDLNTTTEFIRKTEKKYIDSNEHLAEDDMGPMYGFQWRHFNAEYNCPNNPMNSPLYESKGTDQLAKVINELQTDPFSRRILMTTFNPEQVENGVLYPCHSIVIQFYATKSKIIDDRLMISIKMYQRSADLFLGLPFNIASTALLLNLVCDHLNKITSTQIYEPHNIIISLGDTHIYQSHLDAVLTQLRSPTYEFPILAINSPNSILNIEDYEFDDIKLINYISNKPIKAKMVA